MNQKGNSPVPVDENCIIWDTIQAISIFWNHYNIANKITIILLKRSLRQAGAYQ